MRRVSLMVAAVVAMVPLSSLAQQAGPYGIMADPFNGRVYVFSHSAPNATVIDAKDGSVVGTIELGGAPEQAVSDGKGRVYVDLEDKQHRRRGREDFEGDDDVRPAGK